MPHLSNEAFVPLFHRNGTPAGTRPVRLRLGAAGLRVQSLREWGASDPAQPSGCVSEAPVPGSPGFAAGPNDTTGAADRGAVADNGRPMITLCRDGDRIVGIRVRCRCGEVLDLACVYEESGTGTAGAGSDYAANAGA
jgi:hypothetical protein